MYQEIREGEVSDFQTDGMTQIISVWWTCGRHIWPLYRDDVGTFEMSVPVISAKIID